MGLGGDTISTAQLVLVAFEVGIEPASGGEAGGVCRLASAIERERLAHLLSSEKVADVVDSEFLRLARWAEVDKRPFPE